jgi:hypothetical protein
MEPRQENQPNAPESPKELKSKRFRLIKLEERIAPSKGGVTSPGQGCVIFKDSGGWCHNSAGCGI